MLRNPGPHNGSAEAEGGWAVAAVAAPRCRCESARFSFPHSASRPEGEGTRAAAARTGTSLACFPPSTRPSAPPVPSPATASQRAGPLRAGALGLPALEASRPLGRPLCLLLRLRRRNPAPYAQWTLPPPSWEGRRPPSAWPRRQTPRGRHDREVAEGQDAASESKQVVSTERRGQEK